MPGLTSTAERRIDRLSATIPISLLLAKEESRTEFEAFTVDVSRKGVRVRTNFVLFPGDMIGIVPGSDSECPVTTRVVWAKRSASGGSLAGLEFVDTLPV